MGMVEQRVVDDIGEHSRAYGRLGIGVDLACEVLGSRHIAGAIADRQVQTESG